MLRATKAEDSGVAPYALARGVPALQADPGRSRRIFLVSVLLALLCGGVVGYVC